MSSSIFVVEVEIESVRIFAPESRLELDSHAIVVRGPVVNVFEKFRSVPFRAIILIDDQVVDVRVSAR